MSRELPIDGGKFYQSRDGVSSELSDEEVGYVFATAILPEFLTGYEFLKFYMDVNKDKIHSDATIDDYFDLVQIEKADRHRLMKDYSHGMKNKMQMLCCFITKPPVILLDEPLTSFDVVVALEMKKFLRSMRQDHIIIFSTHILQLASDLCDEIVVLHQGKLEGIDRKMLESPEFESRLIEILKDEDNYDNH